MATVDSDLTLTLVGIAIAFSALAFGVLAWLGLLYVPDKLRLELLERPFGDVDIVNLRPTPARFFHIAVRNTDERRVARNCYAYLQSLKDADNGEELVKQTAELQWRGYPGHANVSILPNSFRQFDAFWVFKSDPERFIPNAILSSTELLPTAKKTGDLLATYVVICDNYKSRTVRARIDLDKDLAKVGLHLLS
ncbi:MAG: hypothetical protein L3K16_06635 [Thermoplasmata archaeon]|nr:hypothetical protein [Thermoplasmata archaeon]